MKTKESIETMFTYSRPDAERMKKHEQINECFKLAALLVHDLCPHTGNRDMAIMLCQQARMMANAALAERG